MDDRRSGPPHDDRRKLTDERQPVDDDRRGSVDTESRRKIHDKRRPSTDRRPQYEDEYEELPKKSNSREEDDYDRTYTKRPNHEAKPEILPKVRTSNAAASIFNRPRAPPKINRPVPNNEKKKYEYTPQKSEKPTTVPPAADDELYDDYDYEGEKAQPDVKHEPADSKKSYPSLSSQRDQRLPPARIELMKQEKLPSTFNTDDLDVEDFDVKEKVTSIKPQRSTSPKVEPAPQVQQHQQRPAKTEYYEKIKEVPVNSNQKPALNFNKDEYIPDSDLADYPDEGTDDRLTKEEDEVRQPEIIPTRAAFRPNLPVQENPSKVPEAISIQKPLKDLGESLPKVPYALPQPQPQEDLQYKTKFHRLSPASNARTPNENFQKPNTEDVYTILSKDTIPMIREPSGFKPVSYNEQPHDLEFDSPKSRPYVRIMKRPFLPSRGGSPYLPRGLKPVGTGITTSEYTTEGAHINPKPAPIISNVQFNSFGHNAPISRTNPTNAYAQSPPQLSMQMNPSHIQNDLRSTTQHPQIESPRSPLDEIFNGDYDVTLNDALNPTLKPLSQSHESPIGFSLNKYDHANPHARSDVSHSSSQYRTTAIPIPIRSRQTQQSQQSQYYDDDEYDY